MTEQLSATHDGAVALDDLTRRELEVLALLASGLSNEGIRDALVLSPKTVESHVHSIFLKLGLRGDAAVHARVSAARIWLHSQLRAGVERA